MVRDVKGKKGYSLLVMDVEAKKFQKVDNIVTMGNNFLNEVDEEIKPDLY